MEDIQKNGTGNQDESFQTEQEFLECFNKYKRNRENVSEEELKTRYKNSYAALRKELASKASIVVNIKCLPRLVLVPGEETLPFMDDIKKLADAASKEISRAIFVDMDLEKMNRIIDTASDEIYKIWWENSGEKQFLAAADQQKSQN